MNPMLKIAYDYGCQQAIQDMEKQAGIMESAGKLLAEHPSTLLGSGVGSLAGAVGGYANSEDGQGLRGALAGALGGAALGAGAGRLGKNFFNQKDLEYASDALRHINNNMFPRLELAKAIAPVAGVTGAAGLAGGLGAGYLSGANEQPWYQRMNPFA